MRVLAITRIHGIAGRREDLRALMQTTETLAADEPGCRAYRFAALLDDPDEYLHVQEWEDEAAWDAHQISAGFRAYQRDVYDLLARPSDMQIHRGGDAVSPMPSGPPDSRAVD